MRLWKTSFARCGAAKWAALLCIAFVSITAVDAAATPISPSQPLFCQPNEGNTFSIQSDGTFMISSDCGPSSIVSGPSHGTLTSAGSVDDNPAWIYTATNGYTGTDTFVVSVSSSFSTSGGQGNFDGGGGTETVTFNVIASPPTVTSIAPTAGPTTGGASVTITGTNFAGATAAHFGTATAASFTVVSATSITATAPAGTGTVDITVTTSGGTSTTGAADQFTYVAAPNVTSISPTAGTTTGGTSVTISGTNFTGASAVTFGTTAAASFTVNSATQITATTPPGAGTADTTVTTVGGTNTTSAADQFTYVAAQTIMFTSTTPANAMVDGATYTPTATGGGSGNQVTFSIDAGSTAGACTITSGVVSFTGAGTCIIDANQAGNANYYAAAQVQQSITVGKASSTTALVASPASTIYGQSVTFTATVTSANTASGGTIAFSEGGTSLSGCNAVPVSASAAACTSSTLTVGSDSITATYSGDANTTGSNGATSVVVGKASTTTTLTSPAPITLGNSVSVSASVTVNAPGAGTLTGTIAILDGGSGAGDKCTITLPATSCSLTPSTGGSKTLTATYTPDATSSPNFLGSGPISGTLTVNPAQAGSAVISSVNPSVYGQTVTLTATVTGQTPTGTVTFASSSTSLCNAVALSGGGNSPTATCTTTALPVGAATITANYASANGNNTNSSATLTQTVNQAATTLTLMASPSSISLGGSVTVNAALSVTSPGTGTPTGSITVNDGIGDTCTITLPATSCVLTPVSASNLTLAGSYAGDTNFAGSSGIATLGVGTVATTVTLTSSANPSVQGANVVFTASVGGASAVSDVKVGSRVQAAGHAALSVRVAASAATSPTGTVTFTDNGTLLATTTLTTGTASYATTALTVGTHTIVATYSGDPNDAAASATLTQVVSAAQVATPPVPAPALSTELLALLSTLLAAIGLARTRRT